MNNTVIPHHSIIPNLTLYLPPTLLRANFFFLINLCSAFFSIPVDKGSQYLLAFTWKGQQCYETVMPGFHRKLTNIEGWPRYQVPRRLHFNTIFG